MLTREQDNCCVRILLSHSRMPERRHYKLHFSLQQYRFVIEHWKPDCGTADPRITACREWAGRFHIQKSSFESLGTIPAQKLFCNFLDTNTHLWIHSSAANFFRPGTKLPPRLSPLYYYIPHLADPHIYPPLYIKYLISFSAVFDYLALGF